MVGYWLGVDLGTTYTAAAIHDGSHVRMASIGTSGASIPSVLWLGPDDELLVGEVAERKAATDHRGIVKQFKRRFGDDTPLGGQMATLNPLNGMAVVARSLGAWVAPDFCAVNSNDVKEGLDEGAIARVHGMVESVVDMGRRLPPT